MEAKFSASQASNEAKSSLRGQESQEKAESAAKRRKASYLGSNAVSCCVNILYLCKSHFLNVIYFKNSLKFLNLFGADI